ncbi:MAG: ribonuclease III [Gammaproteobacteria bacterium]|nr:ribonuclease III [Gammaproteobacteria bacterium]
MNDTLVARLIKALEYSFKDQQLLNEALTHRSASSKNNERLEFLGDSILNFVIAAELFKRYPDSPEGDLSRLRSSLVKKEGLVLIARDLNLGEYLTLGSGEMKSGGHRRDSIQADAVEAIFGAVYLDDGFNACQQLILRLYQNQLENAPDPATLKDPKTLLQELLQGRKLPLPRYEVLEVSGKSHQQTFQISCFIDELSVATEGKASSRRKAEQKAALKAIEVLQSMFKKTNSAINDVNI